ncbi:hypothetical protein J5N97_010732 [Dioscorea zingiberensis]|uniref:Lipoyl-binding domain-containing protein n=1 Tax=Dioscorea zingiberensis TaxID=325984 RepID=A0A9D5D0W9_9LILI|nr:hypothetical protein J5N97_010732 [Dioscorea zingiberensis]
MSSWIQLVNSSITRRLADHWAFAKGLVETHLIENFKNDLFLISPDEVAKAHSAGKLSAALVAACICYREHITSKELIPGGDRLLSLWYTNPPFRMHHSAKRKMELEWDKELSDNGLEVFKLVITYQSEGSYLIETEEGHSCCWEIKVIHLGNNEFRVAVDGRHTLVTRALYSKDSLRHMHIWHDEHHHHYRQTIRLERGNDDISQHKSSFEVTSHPKGSVLAPMAGLVVKVLVENGASVEEGQPVLVLEAMKMEHVVKSPRAGYVDGLQVAVGQQVYDTSVLFMIKG